MIQILQIIQRIFQLKSFFFPCLCSHFSHFLPPTPFSYSGINICRANISHLFQSICFSLLSNLPPFFTLSASLSISLSLWGIVSVMQLLCSHITRWSNSQCGFTPGRGVHVSVCVRGRVKGIFFVGQIKGSVYPQKWEWTRRLRFFTCAYILYKRIVYVCWTNVCLCISKWEKNLVCLLLCKEYLVCVCLISLVYHFSKVTVRKLDTECATEGERNRKKDTRRRVWERKRECWHVGWTSAISFFRRSFRSSSAKWPLRFFSSSRLVIIIIVTAKAQT